MSNFKPSKKIVINRDLMMAPNLCDRLTSEDRAILGQLAWQGYDRDEQSRAKWKRRTSAAMDLALQIQKDKSFPWQGCSNVIFPLVTIAALQFSARSYTSLVQGTDIVRYRVTGEDLDGSLLKQADRIARHMSWQVLEEDQAWEEEHDRLFINLGIVGTNFIKSYYDPIRKHPISELVMARDLVLNYFSKSVETCQRKTQIITLFPNEVYERVKQDTFLNVLEEGWFTSGPPAPVIATSESDNRSGMEPTVEDESSAFQFLEQHRYLDLDGDGYAEPYIVTLEAASKTVVRVVARWDREEDVQRGVNKEVHCIKPTEYYTKYSFIPAPDGGIYDVGFGVLLGPLNEAVNTGINQLLDSGTMQNSMGGFLGRGAKIRGGVYTMAPWEWKRVDSTGDDLRKSLVPYPERQPSMVMFSLLGLLINYTDRAAGTNDTMVGENPGQNTPAETMRTMVEQGSQIYSVVFKRVWRSMKEEFKKRHRLNAMFLSPSVRFGTGGFVVRQEDYRTNPDLVVPAADPNITSAGMRMTQALTLKQAAATTPGYNVEVVERNFLRAMRVDGIDVFYPGPDKAPPLPNPNAAVEQIKLQTKNLQFQHEKQMLILQLMENRQLNDAKILELQAKAAEIVSSIGNERAALELEAFNAVVETLQAHNETMNERIKAISGEGENGIKQGGVQQLAATGGNGMLSSSAPGMEEGSDGAMGSGTIPV